MNYTNYTNYNDLPPGRARRLMYSREIQYNTDADVDVDAFIVSRPNIVNNQILTNINIDHIITQEQKIRQQTQQIQQQIQQIQQHKQRILRLQEIQDIYEERQRLQENTNQNVQLINKRLIEKSQVCFNLFDDNFCVICQDDIDFNIGIDIDIIIRVLECTHCFHINCIDKWFTTNNYCPTCKFELS